MLRAFGPGLPSDAIAHRYGFDGNELEEMMPFNHKCRLMGIRSTFAINTWYQEINGGYYVNRSLYVLIDQTMRIMGIFPVVYDTLRPNGLVPVEGVGHLCQSEDYLLINADQKEIGKLAIFEFNSAGGPYYSNNVIFDIILPLDLMEQLVDEVETECSKYDVQFIRVPEAAPAPLPEHWWPQIRQRLAKWFSL